MSKAGVGYSNQADSRLAGTEAAKAAMDRLEGAGADIVMLHATSKHDPHKLHEAVRAVVGPKAHIMGGFNTGIITTGKASYDGSEVGVAVISSKDIKAELFMQPGITGHEAEAGEALGKQIAEKGYGADCNLLVGYDSVKSSTTEGGWMQNSGAPFVAGLGRGLKCWPRVAGFGLLGDMQFKPCYQWVDDRIERNTALAMVLTGNVRMDVTTMHGCQPISDYLHVTRAEGNMLLELDGRPALDVVTELMGEDTRWKNFPLLITFGVNRGSKFGEFKPENYSNRLCMAINAEKKALMLSEPDVVTGSDVQLMRRSIEFGYMNNAIDGLLKKIEGRKPIMALYIDCAGRTATYSAGDKEDAEVVQKTIGAKMPLFGFYSASEIAMVGAHAHPLSFTGVLAILSEA